MKDPKWAHALKAKLLTVERIFGWPEQVVTEIVRALPLKNLACMMKGLNQENCAKITKFMTHAEQRKLQDELGALEAKPEEIWASFVKTVEHTRKMIKDGHIRLEKVVPDLMIVEGFEDKLAHGGIDLGPAPEPPATMNFDPKKKIDRLLRQGAPPKMMYPLVLDLADDGFPVAGALLSLPGFSTQAFNKWRRDPVSQRELGRGARDQRGHRHPRRRSCLWVSLHLR